MYIKIQTVYNINKIIKGWVNMQYVKEASEYLTIYSDLEISEENLEEEIDEIKAELKLLKNEKQVFNNDFTFNKAFKLKKLENNLKSTKKAIIEISGALNKLSEYEKNILVFYYIDGLRNRVLYKELKCSERKFYEDKAYVIRKFAIELFHIMAIA
jgi:DNA-directed RNA polymerase specialized sigma subunit